MLSIITPTYFYRDKFSAPLLELLDHVWPGHPEVWFITDGGGIRHKNVLQVISRDWVRRLHDGLKRFKQYHPQDRFIYLIIEDNYPLWDLDLEQVRDVEETAITNDYNCVVFPPYEFTLGTKIPTKKGFLLEVPKTFITYNQIQPSIWKLDHLIQTCELALEKGISDCWNFEFLVTSGHYVSSYWWPNVKDGLFQHGGFVNREAVQKIKLPEGRRLKELMQREVYLTCFNYAVKRVRDAVRRRVKLFLDFVRGCSTIGT